jgi:hypothetical protein
MPGERWEKHAEYLNRLGNLTLLSRRLNTALKNAPYDQKRPVYRESELLCTQSIAETYEDWSPESVTARQEALAERCSAIWSFPDLG